MEFKMEKEQLLQMVALYKSKLSDAEEKNIMYQIIINNQMKEKDELANTIINLQMQIDELNKEVK